MMHKHRMDAIRNYRKCLYCLSLLFLLSPVLLAIAFAPTFTERWNSYEILMRLKYEASMADSDVFVDYNNHPAEIARWPLVRHLLFVKQVQVVSNADIHETPSLIDLINTKLPLDLCAVSSGLTDDDFASMEYDSIVGFSVPDSFIGDLTIAKINKASHLNVSNTNVTPKGINSQLRLNRHIKILELEGVVLDCTAVPSTIASDISSIGVGPVVSITSFRKLCALPGIRNISLYGVALTDDIVCTIVLCENLQSLSIFGSYISEQHALELLASGVQKIFIELHKDQGKCGIADLLRMSPKCTIIGLQ